MARLLSLLAVFLTLGQATLGAYVAQTNLGGVLYLVNRDFALTQAYEPPDLRRVEVPTGGGAVTLREEAALALEEMFAAAWEEDKRLLAVSGFRSYGRQRAIWRRKLKDTGSQEKAQLYVAPPGASEHQLGLAMDLARRGNAHLNASFGKSTEGQWVADNAHRFGFIIRYRAAWTPITGYADEPWHVRYVGREHAQRIQQLDIPLEDYVALLRQANFGQYIGETDP